MSGAPLPLGYASSRTRAGTRLPHDEGALVLVLPPESIWLAVIVIAGLSLAVVLFATLTVIFVDSANAPGIDSPFERAWPPVAAAGATVLVLYFVGQVVVNLRETVVVVSPAGVSVGRRGAFRTRWAEWPREEFPIIEVSGGNLVLVDTNGVRGAVVTRRRARVLEEQAEAIFRAFAGHPR